MPAKAIDHINIRAPKTLVLELKDFYEGVLGLKGGWRPSFKSTGYWLYLESVPVIHLVDDESVDGVRDGRAPIVDHVSFSCTGLREFTELLTAKRIPFRRTTVPDTALVQLFLSDPAGNGVELQFSEGDT